MELPVETLREIQQTAIKASNNANIQDVQIGRYKYRRILADGTTIDTEIEPNALDDKLSSLDDLAIQYELNPNSQIWVNRHEIILLYDSTQRHYGKATMDIEISKVATNLVDAEEGDGAVVSPEDFEQKGMLLFNLPDEFLNEIRSLQWRKKKESNKIIENASKSMSADDIEVVLTAGNEVFRSRNFIVTTPVYMSPYETKIETIEVKLVVNAKKETITYAPITGTMERLFRKAFEELRDTLLKEYKIDRNRIFCGYPFITSTFNYKKQLKTNQQGETSVYIDVNHVSPHSPKLL
jgi:hypothetical protein